MMQNKKRLLKSLKTVLYKSSCSYIAALNENVRRENRRAKKLSVSQIYKRQLNKILVTINLCRIETQHFENIVPMP